MYMNVRTSAAVYKGRYGVARLPAEELYLKKCDALASQVFDCSSLGISLRF